MNITTEISLAEAQAIAVAAQGLHKTIETVAAVLNRLGCIQIDSMTAIRRSHELVVLSRGVDSDSAARLATDMSDVDTFEGWAHALSLIPLEMWPLFAWRRRHIRVNGWRGPDVDQYACAEVLARLRAEGPLTLSDLGGNTGSGWERSSPARWAAEWLEKTGDLVVRQRRGWRRVYAPVEQALPAELLNTDLDDVQCIRTLVQLAVAALGVATLSDIADYFRLPAKMVYIALNELELHTVTVEGWDEIAWIDAAHACAGSTPEPIPLSPFDPLVWHRQRQQRLFGRDWRLEAYKPAAKRSFGYFTMPILMGTRLAGRIAARRTGDRLRIEATEWDLPDGTGLIHAAEIVRRWTATKAIAWPDHRQKIEKDDTQ